MRIKAIFSLLLGLFSKRAKRKKNESRILSDFTNLWESVKKTAPKEFEAYAKAYKAFHKAHVILEKTFTNMEDSEPSYLSYLRKMDLNDSQALKKFLEDPKILKEAKRNLNLDISESVYGKDCISFDKADKEFDEAYVRFEKAYEELKKAAQSEMTAVEKILPVKKIFSNFKNYKLLKKRLLKNIKDHAK